MQDNMFLAMSLKQTSTNDAPNIRIQEEEKTKLIAEIQTAVDGSMSKEEIQKMTYQQLVTAHKIVKSVQQNNVCTCI